MERFEVVETFNRTIIELKRHTCALHRGRIRAFNRTIIELKRRSIWAEDDRYHLLIGLS